MASSTLTFPTFWQHLSTSFISLVVNKRLHREAFKSTILAVSAFCDPGQLASSSSANQFDIHESSLTTTVDRLLPSRPVRHCRLPLSPWFDAECHSIRRQVRCLERVYKRTQGSSLSEGCTYAIRRRKESLDAPDIIQRQ